MRVGGIVLCGGRSSRMGQPKAWLPIGGETMLERVVRIIGRVVAPVVVVAAPGQDLPPLPPAMEVLRDPEEGRGPLQGLVTGLSALQGRVDAAFLSSCDVPFLQPAFVRRLIDLIGTKSICIPCVDGYQHPLAAVYRVEVLVGARELLAAGPAGPLFLSGKLPTRVVDANEVVDCDPNLQSLRNLNSPEDYEAALRDAALL